MTLSPVRFRYKNDPVLGLSDKAELVCLIAQEVKQVIPEAVSEDDRGYLTLRSDPILWAMLNAIKTQQAPINELKAEVERLSGKVRLAEAVVDER